LYLCLVGWVVFSQAEGSLVHEILAIIQFILGILALSAGILSLRRRFLAARKAVDKVIVALIIYGIAILVLTGFGDWLSFFVCLICAAILYFARRRLSELLTVFESHSRR
jgi:hypothetical protein